MHCGKTQRQTDSLTYPGKVKGVSVDELKVGGVIKDRPQVVKGPAQSVCRVTP